MKNSFNFFGTSSIDMLIAGGIGASIGILFSAVLYFTSITSTTPSEEFVFYPRTTPTNKYSNKQYESILDSLKHENDSLRNELRIYIDGCDHKEEIYEQIIYELEHRRSKKSFTTKDSTQ
jgi:hypothetical protein